MPNPFNVAVPNVAQSLLGFQRARKLRSDAKDSRQSREIALERLGLLKSSQEVNQTFRQGQADRSQANSDRTFNEGVRQFNAKPTKTGRFKTDDFGRVFDSTTGEFKTGGGRIDQTNPQSGLPLPAQMGFSKEQTGRFNASKFRGATDQEAVAEATSTSSERTSNVKIDQALTSLRAGMKRFEKFVVGGPKKKGTGAILNPFSADSTTAKGMRRGIQLQLKELFNLGVLNGPDLALMDEILFNPTLDINPAGGDGVNVPVNAEERAKASIKEINEIMDDLISGRRLPSQFGQRETQASAQSAPLNKTISRNDALGDIRGMSDEDLLKALGG